MDVSYKKVPAKIYNFKYWSNVTNPDILKDSLNIVLDKSGYTVLNYIEHHFDGGGFTALWLLAESHLAVHTFYEDSKTYIELSGCNRDMNSSFEKFIYLSDLCKT